MARSKKPVSPEEAMEPGELLPEASGSEGEATERTQADAPLLLSEPASVGSSREEVAPEILASGNREAPTDATETDGEPLDQPSAGPAEGDPQRDTLVASVAPAPGPPQASGSGRGFAGGLVGGALVALAAVSGVYVANPSMFQAPVMPDVSAVIAPVTARIDSESERVVTLADEVAALREAVAGAETGGLSAQLVEFEAEISRRLDASSAEIGSIREQIDGLETRLTAAERRPTAQGSVAVDTSAYESELAELRAAVEAQNAVAAQMASELERLTGEAEERLAALASEAQAMQDEAADAARSATARAALSLVQAALEGGGPFDGPLAEFSAARGIPAPDALASVAATGVPTLPELLRTFPDAARAALDASIRARLDDSEGAMDRVFAFLQSQSGARSLEPREGDDPDAVLSRAEAALREGRLVDVIALLGALPEPGQAAIASWQAGAAQRAASLDAAAGLAAAMTTN